MVHFWRRSSGGARRETLRPAWRRARMVAAAQVGARTMDTLASWRSCVVWPMATSALKNRRSIPADADRHHYEALDGCTKPACHVGRVHARTSTRKPSPPLEADAGTAYPRSIGPGAAMAIGSRPGPLRPRTRSRVNLHLVHGLGQFGSVATSGPRKPIHPMIKLPEDTNQCCRAILPPFRWRKVREHPTLVGVIMAATSRRRASCGAISRLSGVREQSRIQAWIPGLAFSLPDAPSGACWNGARALPVRLLPPYRP